MRLSFFVAVYAALTFALLATVLVNLGAGRFPVAAHTVAGILIGQVIDTGVVWTEIEERIVTMVRAPRIVLVCLSGAGLAIAGAAMQGVFRNPLASPQILGVSAGAAFGGSISILVGFSGVMMVGTAFVTGVAALLLVAWIARIGGKSENTTVILTGIVVGTAFSALVSLVQLVADPQTSLPAIVFWLMGSFASATWERVWVATPVIVAGIVLLWLMRFRVNILSLGEEEAHSLGAKVQRDTWLIFLVVAMIVAATVSVAGIVGWVGLVIPHATRLLVGHDHRHLLPASCLMGAVFLSLVDAVARSASSAEIPLGVLTALIGAPLVLFLLRRMRRRGELP